MKKGLSLAVAICLGGGALFGGTILTPVDPKAMFLLADTVTPDAPFNPSFIDVTAFQGQTINLMAIGGLCFAGTSLVGTPSTPCKAAGGGAPVAEGVMLAGIFSNNTTLLGVTSLQRVPGAVSSGLPDAADPAQYFTGIATTNSFDFVIPQVGVNVAVPFGAVRLWFGVLDSFYKDNTDPAGTLGVQTITPDAASAPEPGTYALFLSGFGGLLALRRMRSRRS